MLNNDLVNDFFEASKTPEEEIKSNEYCPICMSKLGELDGDNFVCTMHKDKEIGEPHQICRDCFLMLLQDQKYDCPICKANLEIPEEVKQEV